MNSMAMSQTTPKEVRVSPRSGPARIAPLFPRSLNIDTAEAQIDSTFSINGAVSNMRDENPHLFLESPERSHDSLNDAVWYVRSVMRVCTWRFWGTIGDGIESELSGRDVREGAPLLSTIATFSESLCHSDLP